jgi:hypothetical protein
MNNNELYKLCDEPCVSVTLNGHSRLDILNVCTVEEDIMQRSA